MPSASSPSFVEGPSARTSPFLTLSPTFTAGRWLMHVPWFERAYLLSLYSFSSFLVYLTLIDLASTYVTFPSPSARMHMPESTAFLCSMPVATMGASVVRSGTACLCMFAPMRARFASSFSRNGIIEVATETIILGLTSM